jgi:hypothetical protein
MVIPNGYNSTRSILRKKKKPVKGKNISFKKKRS